MSKQKDLHKMLVDTLNDRSALTQPVTLRLVCHGDVLAVAIALEIFSAECTQNGATIAGAALQNLSDQVARSVSDEENFKIEIERRTDGFDLDLDPPNHEPIRSNLYDIFGVTNPGKSQTGEA